MESSEDDAGTATTASRRASAREKDIGQAEDDNATGNAVYESTEARASCGTPAMSEDNFDGDSVPSPSTQDVNTSTEAILDMIDEFVDGPGAPKRLPLSGADDSEHSECVKVSDETSTGEVPKDVPGNPPPTIASPAASAKCDSEPCASKGDALTESLPHNSVPPEIVNTECVKSHQECSVSICNKTRAKCLEPPVEAELVSEYPPKLVSSVEPKPASVCILKPSKELEQASDSPLEDSRKSDQTSECPPESSIESNAVHDSLPGPSKDPQKSKKPSKPTSECHQEPSGSTVPSESKQKPMAKSELAREIPQDASGESGAPRICEQASEDACGPPPVNIPSSSIVESVQSASDVSECERHERTVKCVTSSDSRNDVTIESAESTSSDISLSEEKVSGGEQLTRSPLRRRLVRPAPADRRPDSTVSSTVDIHSTQQLSCESLAKDVSSSSDAVPSIHGNVKPEEIRNVSEISVCKAETSVSPKKIRLIRQKVSAPIRDNVPDNQNNQLESEQCQSTSSDGSILADFVDNTAKSDIVSNSLTHEPQIGLIDASNIKIQLPITKDEFMPSTVTTLKSEESTSSAIKSSLTNEESMEHGDERNLKLKIDVSTPELSETTQAVSKNKDLNEHLQSEPESPKQVPKLTIKLGNKQSEEMKSPVPKLTIKPIKPPSEDVETDSNVPIPNVTKINIKPIVKPPENVTEGVSNMSENAGELNADSSEQRDRLRIPNVTKLNIKPIMKPSEKITDNPVKSTEHLSDSKSESNILMESMPIPNVTKLNIKPVVKPSERTIDSPSKLSEHLTNADSSEQMESMPIPNVTKINIKPIIKPSGNNEIPMKSAEHSEAKADSSDQKPSITKLNIKPIPRPPEKINDTHRKSSSSEISESEYSENDESTSTSDQASASDQGPSDTIPKVTIKLGKPGTTSEGKFYAEKNIPKLTIKGLQHNENEESESVSKLTLVISQPEEKHSEKVPKLTIKTVAKSEGQPLSPKLTIKPLKPPDAANKDINSDHYEKQQSPKCFTSSMDVKENAHVPKITIKPITKLDSDLKPSKKSSVSSDGPEQIPLVTKLNIKPILKPADDGETSEGMEDKVPVVSKLNIKPIVKPKDNEVVSSIDDVPKITKLNIKPLKNPEEESSEEKDCDELNTDKEENSIPVVSKLNIKPIIKPVEEDNLKYSENQSSETGNSSDENTDHIPVVTKINIKPIMKPNELVESSKHKVANEETFPPTVAKLNIKPLVKPEESASPSSPKKDSMKNVDIRNTNIPVVTKLNIKPVIKPEELDQSKVDVEDKGMKKPPLVMKINMKVVADTSLNESLNNTYDSEHIHNNVGEEVPVLKRNIKPVFKPADSPKGADKLETDKTSTSKSDIVAKQDKDGNLSQKEILKQNCVDNHPTRQPAHLENESGAVSICQIEMDRSSLEGKTARGDPNSQPCQTDGNKMSSSKVSSNEEPSPAVNAVMTINKQMTSVKNCTLLKKLLESNESINEKSNVSQTKVCNSFSLRTVAKDSLNCEQFDSGHSSMEKVNDVGQNDSTKTRSPSPVNDVNTPQVSLKIRPIHELCTEANESVTKPLEINISEKISNQSSGQDSPRIILKINKTDHGPSAKIITEEVNKTDILQHISEKVSEMSNDKPSPTKKNIVNSRRKLATESPVTLGKRLRSSRIVESADKSKSPILKRMIGKRPPAADASPQNKDSELTVLESKRLKLGQLLSNKSLTITPVITKKSPESKPVEIKQGSKTVNHTLVNNENCSKNGNSKLHNILTNLQVKQIQSLPFNDINCSDKNPITAEAESNTSTGSSDVVEILRVENCHPDMQEMMINENSDYRDFSIGGDEISQDPLEIETPKTDADSLNESASVPTLVQSTPQPKKRGRPRKLPVSEDAKAPAPSSVTLPVPALEERPQRSLRLSRDRPAILAKPRGGRGRGRGRGRGKLNATPSDRPEAAPSAPETPEVSESDRSASETPGTPEPLDPTSSRVKLPRMTEALDRLPATCATPLSSRHSTERFEAPEMKVVLESTPMTKMEDSNGSTSASGSGARGGRGGARGRGRGARTPRTPRLGRGRGRGGGRGAMYMKETMGIYGRVCGPATTTVQLFEEETCMMDDNATPAKPTHLLDEDSQSSVKSSTNESSKMKKSKFADLFDSNKEWTAADVKEYIWPPADKPDEDSQVMMIQEQVAMFLGVKSFKRRYPELKRRSISGDERDYVLAKGLVTEVLCDLGITAVDASEVLDIMLSDFPHKYEEFRGHQRQKQLVAAAASASEPAEEPKPEEPAEKPERVELKPPEPKHEPPKVDPEKTRQDLAAAAIASAAEWNARLNVVRRPACADLQSLTLHTRRPPRPAPARPHLRPPAGFYPHALLPGQYQHTCRVYTPQQLRYFPLNTAMEAPPMPPSPDSSEESDVESDRTDCSADSDRLPAKRKKLTKVKRSNSHTEREDSRDAEVVDTCRVCKLRLEANRKHTHERFLVCGTCNAKIHPICSELGADTIRKCREYSWQCAACKVCAQCRRAGPALLCCDLCDRGFHPPCLRLDAPPPGRWHCVECAICKSCGARTPSGPAPPAPPQPPQPPADAPPQPPQPSQPQPGPPAEWHHQTKRGPGGHKVYSHSLCTPCARVR